MQPRLFLLDIIYIYYDFKLHTSILFSKMRDIHVFLYVHQSLMNARDKPLLKKFEIFENFLNFIQPKM